MLAIMRAESGCDPLSDNTGLNADGTVDRGLLQINSIHGHSASDLFEPSYNIAVAFEIWSFQGYQAWSAYNSGAHLKFLN